MNKDTTKLAQQITKSPSKGNGFTIPETKSMPSEYLKSVGISQDGNTATFTKQDNTPITFSPQTSPIEKINLNDVEQAPVNKEVNINATTSLSNNGQSAIVDQNGNIDISGLITTPTLKVSVCTNEHDSKNNTVFVPNITLEQFTALIENNYSTIHLLTSGNPVIDIKYSIIYRRDGKNQYTPTLNDEVVVSNGNIYISYSVNNNNVVYTISESANINDIIQPITTNSNYNSNQIYRQEINAVQKLVLSNELVPELVALGYEYSYADIFSWDSGSFRCNTSLYRPVTTGWHLEIVKQQWNKQINTSPYQSENYPTDGQLNTGAWAGMVINEVVVLGGRYRDFFKPWEQGDTGTPIWAQYDGNGNLLQLSFNEISDNTRIVNWYVKDSQGNQRRLSTEEYDWKKELRDSPLILSLQDVFTNNNRVWYFNANNLLNYKAHIYNLNKLEFSAWLDNTYPQADTGWQDVGTINATFTTIYTDKMGVSHTLTFRPKINANGGNMYRGYASLYANSKYSYTALAVDLGTSRIGQYYTAEMLNSTGGVNIFFTYDVELVE